MTDTPDTGLDYSQTLFLPKTDFPMRAGLPQKEPEILARWAREDLYARASRERQGPAEIRAARRAALRQRQHPHRHALNKILKDMVVRSHQMAGKDSNYVPGWDCHGLPIEWKVEEEFYRTKGKAKPDFSDSAAIIAFRRECRAYAEHWLGVQREEFKRLGVVGDWDHPYTTMSFPAEAQIAREIFKFVANGLLYRGSKPVMWSVVEKTALAEAEIEYEDHAAIRSIVAFPGRRRGRLGRHLDDDALDDSRQSRDRLLAPHRLRPLSRDRRARRQLGEGRRDLHSRAIAGSRACSTAAKVARLRASSATSTADALVRRWSAPIRCTRHGYGFVVPLLDGDHVTDDAGTGFVHTAPGHGREDFELWTASTRLLQERGIDTRIPYTVDENGAFTDEAPGFDGKRVLTDKGEKGDANEAVIKALIEAGALIARGKLKHQYPHSWRSKKPVIFRNTPQWFIAMDRPFANAPRRQDPSRASRSTRSSETRWVPQDRREPHQGHGRRASPTGCCPASAPGACRSRSSSARASTRSCSTRRSTPASPTPSRRKAPTPGSPKARRRASSARSTIPDDYDKIDDLVEVWFDSGSTHAFVLEDPVHFPGLAGIRRAIDGGAGRGDVSRGLGPASRLVPVVAARELRHARPRAVRHRADARLHARREGPQDVEVARQPDLPAGRHPRSGADILRLWVASVDYSDDQRIGPEILKAVSDNYRKLRNTIRWMLGTLAHHEPGDSVGFAAMTELDRLMLHKLAELDVKVREAYANFDYARVVAPLSAFMNADLSAFYFDIRKDALYCDRPRASSGSARWRRSSTSSAR